jgi:outer membrane protein assembly factor BamE
MTEGRIQTISDKSQSGNESSMPTRNPMRAFVFSAVRVKAQSMVGNLKALGLGNRVLAVLNLGIVKLLNPATVQAHQVVVVLALVQLKHRLASLKMIAAQNTRLLKLSEYAIDGGQANVGAVLQQHPKHVFSRQVALRTVLKNLHDFQTRQRSFKASAFKFVNVGHGGWRGLRQKVAATMADHKPSAGSVPPACSEMSVFLTSYARCVLMVAASAALAACGSFNSAGTGIFTPYKVEVVQGNVVSKEQVDLLQPGMTRQQVREVLGSPLVTSAFHADRWDYAFTIRRQGIDAQNRKLTVFFKGDVLDKFDGDPMPNEAEFVKSLDTRRKLGAVPVLQATEEQLQQQTNKNTPASQENKASTAPNVVAPTNTVYPPLEGGNAAPSR